MCGARPGWSRGTRSSRSRCGTGAPAPRPISASEARDRLRRAVLALPEELRCVVVARYWADAPATEIAALERVTEVAIRKRLRRALDRLAVAMKETTR